METQQDIAGDIEVDDLEQQTDDQGEAETIDAVDALYGDEGQGDEQEQAEADDDEIADEEAPKVDAPHSWSKEDKEVFSKLDPAAQAVITRRETERDNFVKQKAFEASQTRQQVETQAREVVAKIYDEHVQKLQVYAQQVLPTPPDQRLLYSGDQNLVNQYLQQKAAYDAAVDQQHVLHQQISQAQAAANSAREQSQQAEIASDAQRLQEQLPEWFDPSSGPKLREQLQSIGAELGYPPELMAQASSSDILALKKASEWKAKAEKLDAMMSKRMKEVRSHRQPPKIARPGSSAAPRQTDDILKTLYPND